MGKWIVGLAVVAIVAVVGALYAGMPSDEELILEALDNSIAASREGEAGGVLEYMSRSLTYNGEPVLQRREIANYVRENSPEVTLPNREVVIEGETAHLVSPATMEIRLGPLSRDVTIERVRVEFAKESGTRFGVLPAPKWRISSIDVEEAGDLKPLLDLANFAL